MDSSKTLSPEELLLHHPDYPVLICKACHYAIQPTGIARHLKEIHHIFRSNRRPYMEFASRFNLAKPEDIIQIEVSEFPVRHLPVLEGLQCLGPGPCEHLCVSTKRMQNHWLSVHGRHGDASNNDWRPAALQTFFRGNLLRYFTIRKGTVGGASIAANHGLGPEFDESLFQYYLTSTSLTFVDRHGTEDIWQIEIPQMALQHPFLMHTLLACSALHLAHQDPPQQSRYLLAAHSHQDVAMTLYRRALTHVTEENSHAILAFCYFLVFYAFAADRPEERLLLTDASSPNPNLLSSWLYFVRNSCFMICEMWDSILVGPIGPLAQSWDEELPSLEGDLTKNEIWNSLLSLMPGCEDAITWPEPILQVYRDTAEQLARAFAISQTLSMYGFTTWDAVRMWPMEISVDYVELLNQRHPAALILLAHFCLLLEKIEPHWYFKGRGKKLLDTVLEQLPPDWRSGVVSSLERVTTLLKQDTEMLELPR